MTELEQQLTAQVKLLRKDTELVRKIIPGYRIATATGSIVRLHYESVGQSAAAFDALTELIDKAIDAAMQAERQKGGEYKKTNNIIQCDNCKQSYIPRPGFAQCTECGT